MPHTGRVNGSRSIRLGGQCARWGRLSHTDGQRSPSILSVMRPGRLGIALDWRFRAALIRCRRLAWLVGLIGLVGRVRSCRLALCEALLLFAPLGLFALLLQESVVRCSHVPSFVSWYCRYTRGGQVATALRSEARDSARHPGTARPRAMAWRISMISGPGRRSKSRSTSMGTLCPKVSRYAVAATDTSFVSMDAITSERGAQLQLGRAVDNQVCRGPGEASFLAAFLAARRPFGCCRASRAAPRPHGKPASSASRPGRARS